MYSYRDGHRKGSMVVTFKFKRILCNNFLLRYCPHILSKVSVLYQIAQAKSPPPLPKGLSNEALDFLKLCFKYI